MKQTFVFGAALLLISGLSMCRKPSAAALNNDENFDPRLSGGAATVFDISSGSFSTPVPGLSGCNDHIRKLGDQVFGQSFIAAPAPLYGGLGPSFNNPSCTNCHHNDGI